MCWCNTDSCVIILLNYPQPKCSSHCGIVGKFGVNSVLANVFAQLITLHVTYICYTHRVIVINTFLSPDCFDFLSFLIGLGGPAEVERPGICPVIEAATIQLLSLCTLINYYNNLGKHITDKC